MQAVGFNGLIARLWVAGAEWGLFSVAGGNGLHLGSKKLLGKDTLGTGFHGIELKNHTISRLC